MKKFLCIAVAACMGIFAVLVSAQTDIEKGPSCKFCGMDRKQFGHSRALVSYEDGTATATCSLHCLATELALTLDKSIKTILVADYGTKELIDAEKAFWVIGGNKPGVMTRNAKWAFAKKDEAEKFISANGGTLADFETAVKTAYTDMYQDTKMIREKRKMKKQKMMEGQHGMHK